MPRILWAEDSPEDRALIQEALRQLPYPPQTEFVEDGAQLLKRLEEEPAGLVVLDLGMPGMGGMETLERLREPGRRRVPIVVFTSHDGPGEARQCLSRGARDVIQKPTDFYSFRSAVQRIVTHTAW